MPTTRNIKDGSTSDISNPESPSCFPPFSPASSQQPIPSMSAQCTPSPGPTTCESTPNTSESLPPRMRLKDKRRPFGEFRIIREPAHHTTELKPIPSPPWANDSFSLDSSHRLHDNTRGRETSHARASNATPCVVHSRNNSRSSAKCSTPGSLHPLSIASAYPWTALPTSGSPAVSSQTDDPSSDPGLPPAIAYQLHPHRSVKPRARSAQTMDLEERAQSVPDEDEDEMAMATAALKQLQHSGTEANTFPPPARPSRKQKRYACDVCGQIFTRSGDVRRHKESRHDNSEGCRCPFCDRVLTRQDALQRHWDKYCRKKSKRHLDKQEADTQDRTTSSMPTPVYTPGMPTQTTSTTTMGIGIGRDQTQINYRYLNIFG